MRIPAYTHFTSVNTRRSQTNHDCWVMALEIDFHSSPLFQSPGAQYEIVDVDNGRGQTEQIIITNDPFQGLLPEQEAEADEFVGRRFGKYRPLFNGVFVIGPQSSKLFVSMCGYVALGGLFGSLYPTIKAELAVFVFYVGEFLILCCVSLLFWTCGTDPGIVPRDFNLRQYLVQIRNNHAPHLRPRWCRKCQSARPARCYHCRECDICIRRQDMHLLMGGVCVGSRNFKQYLAFNVTTSILALYVLAVSVTLIIKTMSKYDKDAAFTRTDFHLSCILMFCGATLLSFPQSGFIMFVYRVYLISRNRTMREEYRAYLRANDQNPFDVGILFNWWEFLGKSVEPSYFRRKKNQIDPCTDPNHRWRELAVPDRRNSQALYFPANIFGSDGQRISTPRHHTFGENERVRLAMNSHAKLKSHCSLPILDNGELKVIPGFRIRRTLYPRPFELLTEQIKHYQFCQSLPKCIQSSRKFKSVYRSMSESCLADAGKDVADIVHQARAYQIQQVIGCVLRRDRRGLIELARRIDVAGLVGMDHFDPDDIQMIELNNGLPLLSARNRRPAMSLFTSQQHDQNGLSSTTTSVTSHPPSHHNSLGIPQMVAAGLMPTIRRQQQHAATALALARIHDYSNSGNSMLSDLSPHPSTLYVQTPVPVSRRGMFRSERQRRRSLLLARVHAAKGFGGSSDLSGSHRSRNSIRSRTDAENNNNSGSDNVPRSADDRFGEQRVANSWDRARGAAQVGSVDSRVCVVYVDEPSSRQQPSNS